MNPIISIQIDYRESRSGIEKLLTDKNIRFTFTNLEYGDYVVNGSVFIERKTADDFIQSLVANRLFAQCSILKNNAPNPLILIEGNPYTTSYAINERAIKGTLLSLAVSWQLPIIYSESLLDTVEILEILGVQNYRRTEAVQLRKGYKPKKLRKLQLHLLQSLPGLGPKLSIQILREFGNIKSFVNSTEAELMKIKGIGKKAASNIRTLLDLPYS